MRILAPSARRVALALVLGLAAACGIHRPAAPRPAGLPLVAAVETVGMTVADLGRSVDFYTRVLGFTLVSEAVVAGRDVDRLDGVPGARKRLARLALGGETIELAEYVTPRGRPVPPDARSNDATFQHVAIVTSDMRRAVRRLRRAGVRPVSAGPQRLPDWNPNAGGIEAFYFRDPDGHVLEAIHFPVGKGDARWQCSAADGDQASVRRARGAAHAAGSAAGGVRDVASAARGAAGAARGATGAARGATGPSAPPPCPLFQGIDHTAIVVADTARSLVFYRDVLGLCVAGGSENWGPEQERLNAVAGAHLRITGLRAGAGPGVELLEYLAPRDGKAAPADVAANDLVHWETTLASADVALAVRRLAAAGVAFVSPRVVPFADEALGFSTATMVRDPDGHALRLVTH